ncbi:MAG: DUF2335 domain-containing protein [Nitrosomonadales bacterium]|nr:DUF2335 domain-containing protein [Nitrosomonadales bacterium]
MADHPKNPPQKNPVANAVSGIFSQPQVQPINIAAGTQTQVYQGPIPPPEVLRGFDQLVPGTAERLINLAENESTHRRQMEKQAMDANISAQQSQLRIGEYQSKAVFRSDTIGQAAGLVVSLACIAGAVYLGANGHEVTAGVLAAIPTAAVIRAFFVPKLGDQSRQQNSPK